MNRIAQIDDFISKEHSYLRKSVNKPKTLETIVQKEQILDSRFQEYNILLKLNQKKLD